MFYFFLYSHILSVMHLTNNNLYQEYAKPHLWGSNITHVWPWPWPSSLHCTMGKLKKLADSDQLWELISPQFFAENT